MKHRIAITTTLVALISCLLTSIGQPARAQDWKVLWEQEHARCFANGFDSTAYANSNIVPVLEKAVEKGDAESMYELGLAHGLGKGCQANRKKSNRYYLAATRKGYKKAQ